MRIKYLFFNAIRIRSFLYKPVASVNEIKRCEYSPRFSRINFDVTCDIKPENHSIVQRNDLVVNNKAIDRSEGVLAECNEDVSSYTPYYVPSFNFAAYVNKSYTLQQLVKLGVNLHKFESMKGVPEAILQLDFDRDVQKYLLFFNDVGVPPEEFGNIITKCPAILFQDIDNLQTRIHYLESKNFVNAGITRIITKNPFWFTWRTQDIDYRLGFFQKEFHLSGDEVRLISVKMPVLITYSLSHIKHLIFSVKEEMGFNDVESKLLLLNKPKVYKLVHKDAIERFDYLHNIMKLPHSMIAQQPDGLLHRKFRLQARHGFLELLSRNQYDPSKPNYVSMKALLSGTDSHFATHIAKTSIQTYNKYLKSL